MLDFVDYRIIMISSFIHFYTASSRVRQCVTVVQGNRSLRLVKIQSPYAISY